MRRPLLAFAFLLLGALLARYAPAQPASTERRAEAAHHFEVGLELVQQQAWDSALVEFLRSRQLFPLRNAVRNAAVCLRELHRYDEALETYDSLLQDFGKELPEADRQSVVADIAKLGKYVAFLAVESDPPGATVVVDGRERGKTPLDKPVRVTIGTRNVRVYREGYAPYETPVFVASGETQRVSAKLSVVSRLGTLRVTESTGRVFEVLCDGAVVGATPWEGPLLEGTHEVSLRNELDMGGLPREVRIETNKTTEVSFETGVLPGDLRVEPSPTDARVAVDGRVVSVGTWSGRVPSGDHVVLVTHDWYVPQRVPVHVSSRTPITIRPSLEQIPRVYGEIFGGVTLPPGFKVLGTNNCADGCIGNMGGGRGGYMISDRFGVELFIVAAMALDRDSRSTITVNGHPVTGNGPGGPVSVDYAEHADVGATFGGLSVAYHFFDRWPLTLRFAVGAARLAASVSYPSQLAGQAFVPYANVGVAAWSPILGPEVRFGYRFSRSVMMDVGAALYLFDVPAVAQQSDQSGQGFPPSLGFAGGPSSAVAVTPALHIDL